MSPYWARYLAPPPRSWLRCTNRPKATLSGTGGPQTYTGKDVLAAHKHMNIDEQELVSAIDDVMTAMTKNGYEQAEKNDILAILYSLKGDVVRV